MNFSPDLSQLDAYSMAYHSIRAWNRIIKDEYLPSDIQDKIDDILLALEYIEGWEPSDADVMENNPVGTAWHDGCR